MRWFFFLLFFSTVYAISSSEAIETLGACLRDRNPQLATLSQPFLSEGTSYWVLFYPFSHGRRMVVGVSQDDATVLSDDTRLRRMADGVYDHLVFEEFIKKKNWGATSLQPALESVSRIIDEQKRKLDLFATPTREKYPALTFGAVESSLNNVQSKVDSAASFLTESVSQQQFHESGPSVDSAELLLRSYNQSFEALFEAFSAFDQYLASISEAEAQVYKMSIPDPDNKNINVNLQNLRDLGLASLYSRAKSADPRTVLAKFNVDKEKWVDDSVSSFLFQDLSCRANTAFEKLLPEYQTLLRGESVLRREGFGEQVEAIKEDLRRLEIYKERGTAESYKQLLDGLPVVQQKIATLKEQFERASSISPTSKPSSKPLDALSIGIVVVILALGAYGIWLYRKKQQEQEEGL